mmetsp:Transcript_109292/g.304667  ORF Transcript_109292/g.304667 Transcript_109292/m.304667 type:complete len:261 (-) Transcript_109292:592-1374(-)
MKRRLEQLLMISTGITESKTEQKPRTMLLTITFSGPDVSQSTGLPSCVALPEASKNNALIIKDDSNLAVNNNDRTEAPAVMQYWLNCVQGCRAAKVFQANAKKLEAARRSMTVGTAMPTFLLRPAKVWDTAPPATLAEKVRIQPPRLRAVCWAGWASSTLLQAPCGAKSERTLPPMGVCGTTLLLRIRSLRSPGRMFSSRATCQCAASAAMVMQMLWMTSLMRSQQEQQEQHPVRPFSAEGATTSSTVFLGRYLTTYSAT